MLRGVGLVPTIQRLAVLECLYKTTQHPTADGVLSAVRKKFPPISRATVYNTLDALAKAGMVLRLHVDPAATRYDADLGPHAHFRCRVCRKVYDIEVGSESSLDARSDGHLVESVETYAYGVCSSCREASIRKKPTASSSGPSSGSSKRTKERQVPSSLAPDPSDRKEGAHNA
jgi:Fur family peroxide stress response transcriptional regulator